MSNSWRVCAVAIVAGAVVWPVQMAAQANVRGTVRDAQGGPVVGAEVQWLPSGTVVRTRDDGSYVLAAVPAGAVSLRVRRLGYLAAQRELQVAEGTTQAVDWRLERAPQQMAVLNVNARREPSDARLAGFRARVDAKRGGHFITRDRIEQSGNRNLVDAMRGIPGVRISAPARNTAGRQLRFRNNSCPPVVFIDGFAASAAEFDFESIDLNMVEGIEIYASSSTVPPELLATRGLEQCGVVAIWSRPAQPRPPKVRDTEDRRARLAKELAAGEVLTAEQVDEAAELTNGDLEVVYPEGLWRAGVGGSATVEFVVDDRGRLDWGTLQVVSATHAEFGKALMEALVLSKWGAARKGQKAVSQLVVLTTDFQKRNPAVTF